MFGSAWDGKARNLTLVTLKKKEREKSNELKLNILNGRQYWQGGREWPREAASRWGEVLHTLANLWTFAPLHLTICQTPALFGVDSGGEICSFPLYVHMCVRLCILWVHYSSAMCFVLSKFHSENATHMFTKQRLCGNPLKETKIPFQTEAKCRSPQIFMWLWPQMAALFIQPQHWTEGFSLGSWNISVFPNGRRPLPPCWWPRASVPAKSWGKRSLESHVG